MKLLSAIKANTKIQKGIASGYATFPLHLAPANLSGYEACVKRTVGCTHSCLNTAGRGKFTRTQLSRINKTKFFFEQRQTFLTQLVKEIRSGIKSAKKQGLIPCFRLNTTSDIPWEKYTVEDGKNIFQMFPDIQFYDYTKILGRKVSHIPNYHLTFSAAESNQEDVKKAIAQGMNVAVVFDELPATYLGRKVISGDETDLRFLDDANVIVGLVAKGKAKKDTSGFVVRFNVGLKLAA